jgi:predicted acyltransferase
MAFFYLVIDVWGLQKWAFPLKVIGMNAIAVYMATELFDFRKIGNVFVGSLSGRLGDWNGLVQHTAAFLVVWLILYYMYRKKTFIKV